MADRYAIHVQGWLDPHWEAWFEPLAITHSAQALASAASDDTPSTTMLSGPVRDQAALRAILNKLFDLNLCILQVQRYENVEVNHDAGVYPSPE